MVSLDSISTVLEKYPNFRKTQAYEALYKGLYDNWDQATTLPPELRTYLNSGAPLDIKNKIFNSRNKETTRALIYLDDNRCIETVLMRSNNRNSVCVSTQVGCPMGCSFCDSGRSGLVRNLTVSEIIGQILFYARYLNKQNSTITNITFMGMGEPFLNYSNLMEAIKIISNKNALGLSLRRFSISTSGIIPGVKKLSEEKSLPVNLAVSLHSAVDKKRTQIMPVNKKYPIKQLESALHNYFQNTKRKIMYEYILLSGFNTSNEDVVALKGFIDSVGAAYSVNLIPINKTKCGYSPPTEMEIKTFKQKLDQYKINYIQRYAFGQDIQAGCGQLARRENA